MLPPFLRRYAVVVDFYVVLTGLDLDDVVVRVSVTATHSLVVQLPTFCVQWSDAYARVGGLVHDGRLNGLCLPPG